ncbi:MAG TPA: glutamyl-tRNA reductase, partial [Chloroflexota bacterium]|nr:glutamyl-tRNA reductase [Chloroflexota bacterium]
ALDAAIRVASATPVLVHAFHDALRVGRRARSETFIGRHAVSVSYAAVELARGVFGRLQGCQAVVVGAGETGELTARTLVEHGVTISAVANRTLENAQRLATGFGGRAVGLGDLPSVLATADILVSATDAPGYVVTRSAVADATAARDARPLFLFDIAVPRDVDPRCAELPNVILYGIDDLRAHCDANQDRRSREATRVRAIVDDEVGRFLRWESTRAVLPTVIALRARADEIREAEVVEARARLRRALLAENGGDPAQIEAILDDLSRALVNKLLHDPTVRLKANPEEATLRDAVVELFGLSSG